MCEAASPGEDVAYGKMSQGPAGSIVRSQELFSFTIPERINLLFILISKTKTKKISAHNYLKELQRQ